MLFDREFAPVSTGYTCLNAITQSVLLALKGFQCAVDWDGPALIEVTSVDAKHAAGGLVIAKVLSDGQISSLEEDNAHIELGDPDTEGLLNDILMAYIVHLKPFMIYGTSTQVRSNA